ncbi:DAK2 domain-containing protein [Antribacter gilvus]|uniref:DAK2 domain-containing protein n=1 Tax=Antribacter gilvus TaxID=2304675 RepID=UPI0013DE7B59|nr:DAK2 domain-containing protein [Antribacter gilvus]
MTDVTDSAPHVPARTPAAPSAEALDPRLVRAWAGLAARSVGRERVALDRVNVFPVADADTGTNLYLTLREGERAVRAAAPSATGTQLLGAFARGALLGARGNSGVILSEWLRGLAVAARRGGGPADLLAQAARSARAAVADPAEGTILTAADEAAEGARGARVEGATTGVADGPAALLAAVRAGADAAREAARASVRTLDALSRAGVLDAGACGLVLVLDSLVAVVSAGVSEAGGTMEPVTIGIELDLPRAGEPGRSGLGAPVVVGAVSAPEPWLTSAGHEPLGAGSLELMFVLTRPGATAEGVAEGLRARLGEVGDSVVVVGGDSGGGDAVWQGHVHTDDLAAALAVASAFLADDGTLAQVHVRHLEAAPQHEWGVVVATAAPALAAELALAGAVVLLTGGFGGAVEPLSAADVHRAAASTGARRALVLPGDARAAAADAARSATSGDTADLDEVVVLDAATDVHAVVALAALGTLLPVDDTYTADASGVAAEVQEALAGLRVVVVPGAEAEGELERLLASLPDAEVVTALLDDDVPPGLAERLAGVVARLAPDAELVARATGRPGGSVQLGAEDVDGPPDEEE